MKDYEEFFANYDFSSNFDNTEVTICVKADEPFDGIRLEATLKAFIEGYADNFDDLLDNDRELN